MTNLPLRNCGLATPANRWTVSDQVYQLAANVAAPQARHMRNGARESAGKRKKGRARTMQAAGPSQPR
ncbi:hypothetical protein N7466_008130 [Penicillium verhagenii]|uniref:uncharacterized protein n=1 Tax=Penicillium verhagenii TaxID=1562060 RepID=UPI0025452829|nr:uncharacterized protein N7466_008130 [Penicillium verhagenii]KAJ5923943.1 hypothetical protein N7466_008130 [Penicillium verhagenii]